MNKLLFLLFFCCFYFNCFSQTGLLFVMKGAKKKKEYVEGSTIFLRLHDNSLRYGLITRLMNDTIYLVGKAVPMADIKEVLLTDKRKKKFRVSAKEFLLITGGVVLTTAGITLSKQRTFKTAALSAAVIGYGNLAVIYVAKSVSLKRRKYRVGKKFRLHMIDFYLPRQKAF